MQTSILNTLRNDTKAHLQAVLVDDVTDTTKVILVQAAKLTTQPASIGLVVVIKGADDQWRNTLNFRNAGDGTFMNVDYEIGQASFWRRRFHAELKLFFPPETTQDNALMIGNVILSRAEHALAQPNWFTTTPDSFGEQASESQVLQSYLREGGSDGQWEQTGTIWFEFVTEKSN